MTSPAHDILSAIQIDPALIRFIKPPSQRSRYQAIINWLTRYQPSPESSNLDHIRGLLETFHHLCDSNDWEKVSNLLQIRLNTPTQEELDNQLHTWGYYAEQISIYQAFLKQINQEWDAIALNGLGIAHNSLGHHHETLTYNQQQLAIATERGDEMAKADLHDKLGYLYLQQQNDSQAIPR